MKSRFRGFAHVALAALVMLVAGCGKSPTAPQADAPDPPPVEVAKPVAAVIQAISVTKFPGKKSDGSDWDVSLLAASRRPDPYVILQIPSIVTEYVSNVETNAVSGRTYTFTKPYSAFDGSLPARIVYDNRHRIYVMDKDVGGDDDQMGWITVNLPNAYHNDNSVVLDYTFTDSSRRLSVRIVGEWRY